MRIKMLDMIFISAFNLLHHLSLPETFKKPSSCNCSVCAAVKLHSSCFVMMKHFSLWWCEGVQHIL